MSRSISKALVLSFLFHYLFVLVFLRFEAEPSIEKSLPVINVQLQAWSDGLNTDDDALTEPREDVGVNPGSAVEEEPALNSVTGQVAEISDLVVEEPQTESPQLPRLTANHNTTGHEPDGIPSVADAPAESRDPASSESVVMAAISEKKWTRPSSEPEPVTREPEKLPVSDSDRGMLENKFRQWSEDFHEMGQETTSLDWKHEGRAYTASFRQSPAEGDMGLGHVIVEVTREEGDTRLTTKMRMKNLAFSNYAQFVNQWNPNVQIHNDVVDGRFHANSEVHLLYTRRIQPTFHGKVTTSYRGINTSGSRGRLLREEIFLGGLETSVKRIEMPKRYSPFPDESPVTIDQVRVFEADTRITFYSDGSYGWRHVESTAPEKRVAISGKATYLVGARKTTLHVKGVVDGRVLVYSPEKIVIEDDLVYAEQPDTVPDSDDYLGLVTDRSIEIAGPELTGPGDLQINAAMYARGRFAVKRFMAENEGTLSIRGSLAIGSMSATEPRYNLRIRFDKRLENLRPPRFPVTNRYETVAWDGKWETE
jgi:hypothetical protein